MMERKAAGAVREGEGGVRYTEHVLGDGPRLPRHACRLGLKGAKEIYGVADRLGQASSGTWAQARFKGLAAQVTPSDMRCRRRDLITYLRVSTNKRLVIALPHQLGGKLHRSAMQLAVARS